MYKPLLTKQFLDGVANTQIPPLEIYTTLTNLFRSLLSANQFSQTVLKVCTYYY